MFKKLLPVLVVLSSLALTACSSAPVKVNGPGKLTESNGRVHYEGNLKDDVPNGNGKLYFTNGKLSYEGDFVNGKKEGFGKEYYFSTGEVAYVGEFRNDKREGLGISYDTKGKLVFKGTFKDGSPLN